MFLFMTFYQCFFIMFLNKRIEKISIIYYVLSHSISQQTRFSLKTRLRAQSTLTEKTSIIYYVLSHSILWRARFSLKTWLQTQFALTEKISTIYYVLSHSISRFSLKTRMSSIFSYWENLYHLLCAFSFYFSIFFENTHELNSLLLRKPLSFYFSTNALSLKKSLLFNECFLIESSYWGNLYYLLCAFSFYSSTSVLKTSLLFTMCFFDERIVIEKPSIILYVLSHRVLRRAHCHWENLYYLVSAFPVIDVRDLASTLIMIDVKSFLETLRKSLLFSRCFPIIFLNERIEKR